ncbi:MAG: mandelate racemase/muconate lactonizing enzyme family protein [Propionibacteriaceae bacterium]
MDQTRNVFRDEALLVEVVSDSGHRGWAETNGLMTAIKDCIDAERPHPRDRGVRYALLGESLDDADRLIRKLRANTVLTGRSGLGRVAVAAVETAIVDLVGKLQGKPAWQILAPDAEPVRESLPAYITVFNRGEYDHVVKKALEDVDRGLDYGYTSFKIEATNYNTDAKQAVDLFEAVRNHVSDEVELFVDNVYRWEDYESAKLAAQAYKLLGAQFMEDPFLPERYDLWQRLSDEVGLPLATGGGMDSRQAFVSQMDLGGAAIIQPGVHVAGLYGAHEVCAEAEQRGKAVTTFSVCATTLTPAGSIHLAAANPVVSYVEYAPAELFPNLVLRAELAGPEPTLVDGRFLMPTTPGVGADVDLDALHRYRVEA